MMASRFVFSACALACFAAVGATSVMELSDSEMDSTIGMACVGGAGCDLCVVPAGCNAITLPFISPGTSGFSGVVICQSNGYRVGCTIAATRKECQNWYDYSCSDNSGALACGQPQEPTYCVGGGPFAYPAPAPGCALPVPNVCGNSMNPNTPCWDCT